MTISKKQIIFGAVITAIIAIVVAIVVWFEPITNKVPQKETKDQEGVLLVTTLTHLDRRDDPVYEGRIERYTGTSQMLSDLAELYDKYGAKLTLEASTDFALAEEQFDGDLMSELVEAGHGIGAHVDHGIDGTISNQTGQPVSDVTYDELVDYLVEQKMVLEEAIDQPIVHASGTPSPLDWVSANAEAGYDCHTSVVTYYLVSLDLAERPRGWTDQYILDGNYHQAFPFDPADRVNPWIMDDGTNWIEHDPDGQLVYIPGESGTHFGFLHEFYEQGITNHVELLRIQEFTEKDIQVAKELVLESIGLTSTDQINTFYFMLSLSDIRSDYENGFPLLESWLSWMADLQAKGKIEWANIPEMCTAYTE